MFAQRFQSKEEDVIFVRDEEKKAKQNGLDALKFKNKCIVKKGFKAIWAVDVHVKNAIGGNISKDILKMLQS